MSNIPGTFGTRYETAEKLLGKDAEPYELDPPQPGVKALPCDKCAPLPMAGAFQCEMADKDRRNQDRSAIEGARPNARKAAKPL